MTRTMLQEELQSYLALKTRIKYLEKEIEELKVLSTSLGNSIGDGMPHGSSDGEAKHVKYVNKICDYQIEQLRELSRLQEQKERVIELINLAPTRKGREVLELRYRYGNSVKTISKALHKSDTNIRAIQNRAIDAIVEKLNYT